MDSLIPDSVIKKLDIDRISSIFHDSLLLCSGHASSETRTIISEILLNAANRAAVDEERRSRVSVAYFRPCQLVNLKRIHIHSTPPFDFANWDSIRFYDKSTEDSLISFFSQIHLLNRIPNLIVIEQLDRIIGSEVVKKLSYDLYKSLAAFVSIYVLQVECGIPFANTTNSPDLLSLFHWLLTCPSSSSRFAYFAEFSLVEIPLIALMMEDLGIHVIGRKFFLQMLELNLANSLAAIAPQTTTAAAGIPIAIWLLFRLRSLPRWGFILSRNYPPLYFNREDFLARLHALTSLFADSLKHLQSRQRSKPSSSLNTPPSPESSPCRLLVSCFLPTTICSDQSALPLSHLPHGLHQACLLTLEDDSHFSLADINKVFEFKLLLKEEELFFSSFLYDADLLRLTQ
ncbi:unnamed protein product [Rodentolepis nana]|uniref:Origin recognition complex subunit n=1 Tax=Rodentolepis nana TaxID=102285 RepID=A0A0R3T3Q2_RODNA|nr:unnamed protein product [Rodentolepis nana]